MYMRFSHSRMIEHRHGHGQLSVALHLSTEGGGGGGAWGIMHPGCVAESLS